MSLAVIHTRAAFGIDAPEVTVEVHLSSGLPAFHIVGLPETAVKESKDRVRSAILNSHFDFPDRRITVNLAPADLPKDGGRFDLAIALGILAASEQLPSDDLTHYECLAELALTGELRPVNASLPAALACKQQRRALITAPESAPEAALSGTRVFGAANLLQVCAHLNRRSRLTEAIPTAQDIHHCNLDLSEIRGQHHARRALEIAASGGHNLLSLCPI